VDKDYLIKLTLAVYRVTELFPENENLRGEMRNLANEILANLVSNNSENSSRNIEEIKNIFGLAEAKDWVDSRNFLVLQREYDKIEKLLGKEQPISTGKTVENSFSRSLQIKERTKKRQERIVEILKGNKETKLGDLIRAFPGVNPRTLIRDLDSCLQVGLLAKTGNGRGAFYTVRNVT